jgi:hypothetical protein
MPIIQNISNDIFSADKISQNSWILPAYEVVPKKSLVLVVDMWTPLDRTENSVVLMHNLLLL